MSDNRVDRGDANKWVEYKTDSRVFWVHTDTKEKVYEKPLCLATGEERQNILTEKQNRRDFFAAMESNIIRRLSSASAAATTTTTDDGYLVINAAESKQSGAESSRHQLSLNQSKECMGTISMGMTGLTVSGPDAAEKYFDFNTPGSELVSTERSSNINLGMMSGVVRSGSGSISPTTSSSSSSSSSSSGHGLAKARTISSLDLTSISQSGDATVLAEVNRVLGVGSMSLSASTDADVLPRFLRERKDSMDHNDGKHFPWEKEDRDTATAAATKTHTKEKQSCDRADKVDAKKRARRRRNSTGTMYVTATMAKQDNEATIKCVCSVIHAYIEDAARLQKRCQLEYSYFQDFPTAKRNNGHSPSSSIKMPAGGGTGGSHYPPGGGSRGIGSATVDDWVVGTPPARSISSEGGMGYMLGSFSSPKSRTASEDLGPEMHDVPNVDTIILFFKCIFNTSQLEGECIIICLIYCDRLIKESAGRFVIRHDNWRSTIFVCLVMASKVWDDLSMWNSDFSQIVPGYDLGRLNKLELRMLEQLKYDMKVPAGQYAKYYFILRSLITQLGISGASDTEKMSKNTRLDLSLHMSIPSNIKQSPIRFPIKSRGAIPHLMSVRILFYCASFLSFPF
jgi:hypothetical protein